MDKILSYIKCYGGPVASLFAGFELAHGNMMVGIPALLVAAYLVYNCKTKCCTTGCCKL